MSNAGFDDVNGFYTEITQNVFELKRNNTNRIYQIVIDSDTPFSPFNGDVKSDVWSIKRSDGFNDIVIYINKNQKLIDDKNGDRNENNDNDWECIVGNKPFPLIETLKSTEDIKDKMEKYKMEQNNKRKAWKAKSNVLYWSRTKQNFIKGKILEVNQGFIYIETEKQKPTFIKDTPQKPKEEEKDDEKDVNIIEIKPEFYEKICIEINSPLIQPDVDENFYKRKLKKKQTVFVWSRNELRFKQGLIANIDNDFVYVQCGNESRYIQKDSFLIQSV